MKRFSLLLSLILLFSIASTAQNVGDRTKDKAENKANNRIDTRIDQGLDKGLNAIEGLFKKKDKKKNTSTTSDSGTIANDEQDSHSVSTSTPDSNQDNGMSGMQLGGMLTPAIIEDAYSFDLDMDIHVTNTNKKGKVDESDMAMFFSNGVYAFGINEDDSRHSEGLVIFDNNNSSMITLTDEKGKKEGVAMNMPKAILEQMGAQMEEHQSNSTITATGNTKTILGKSCSEYLLKDPENNMESTFWMTTDISYDVMGGMMGMMGQSAKKAMPDDYPQGFMMEAYGRDTKKGDSWKWEVTKLNESSDVKFDMGAWNVMDIMGKKY